MNSVLLKVWIFTSCLFIIGLLLTQQTVAQEITLSGYLADAASKENLIGATVYHQASGHGTVTNTYGFFSLTLPQADSVILLCSYVGYVPQLLKLQTQSDTSLNVLLHSDNLLEEVVVVAEEQSDPLEQLTQMSSVSIPVKQIKLLPALLGETDVIKALQLMPGVQSGSEGGSGLYVRGGGPDQNLILLDGVPVYNISHLFGFFSIFNPDAVNRVELIKGGFPARYGGRLSSVLDISLKEGNMQEFHGEGSVGLISSKLTLEGPLVKDKASFMVSGRRTYIDLLARPLIRAATEGDETVGYHFHDVNAKFNYKVSPNDRLYLSMYTGRDKGYSRYRYDGSFDGQTSEGLEESGLRWGNTIAALRWNHLFNQKLFSNFTLTYSEYQFDVFYEDTYTQSFPDQPTQTEFFGESYLSGINDWAARADFDFYPNANHSIRFGAHSIYHTFKPGALSYIGNVNEQVEVGSDPIYATEASAYIEDDMKFGERLNVNVGLHASAFWVNDKSYTSIQPRLAARYLLPNRMAIKASYAQMVQFIHLLTNAGIGLPTDLWVPTTDQVQPQEAFQAALGIAKTVGKWEVSLEGYYKEMENLIEYKDGASFIDVESDWQDKVESGQGWSYGMEVLIQKKQGKTTGWLGYTLSWADRRFQELNFGRLFPYRFDRRHDISIAMVHHWKPNIDFSMAWVYGTGNAVTLATEVHEAYNARQDLLFSNSTIRPFGNNFGSQIEYYDGRNGFRMRAYHRLDVSLAFKKEKKWGERVWTIGTYNTYSRLNPFYLERGFDYDNDNQPAFFQYSLFPIIPSVSYSFKF